MTIAVQLSRKNNDANGVAIYRLFDANHHLLYVGISNNPMYRFEQHAADKEWWREVSYYRAEWLEDRVLALTAETDAIWLEQPKYNRSRPYSSTERVWRQAAKRFPILLRLEAECCEMGFQGCRCLWPDILHQLRGALHGEASSTELEIARERLDALLPESCACPECWSEERWGE